MTIKVSPELRDLEFSFLVNAPSKGFNSQKIDVLVDTDIVKTKFNKKSNVLLLSKEPNYSPQPINSTKKLFTFEQVQGAIGTLESSNSLDKKFCNGFFINERDFITNNHCLVSTKSACPEIRISVQSNGEIKKYRCLRLIRTSEYLDYAIIRSNRLKNPKQPSLQVATTQFEYRSSDTLWIVTLRDKKKLISECKPFDNGLSSAASVLCDSSSNCRLTSFLDACNGRVVISGDSGSPILDSKGRVIGLLWGAVSGDKVKLPAYVPSRLITPLQ
ncbi:S1 family peptidase [Pseudobacteriovorax antillogorgiicola]|nr:serine protease [Pseudobacteriovorax antillogorgiicola]